MINGDMRALFDNLLEALMLNVAHLQTINTDSAVTEDAEAYRLEQRTQRLVEWAGRCLDKGFNDSELSMLGALPIANEEERANVGPAGERIKDWEELRHTLAHLWNAIDHLVDGFPETAGAELQACQAGIFWDSIDEMRADLDGTTTQSEPMLGGEQAADAPEAERQQEAQPPVADK
jgi:hypothetical protein